MKNEEGKVCGARIVSLAPKKDEKSGRMMMVPVEGTEKELPVDLVLIAAGFLGSEGYVAETFGVECNERTNIKTAPGAYETTVERVFTAGDMHRGQSLVVWALKSVNSDRGELYENKKRDPGTVRGRGYKVYSSAVYRYVWKLEKYCGNRRTDDACTG